MRVGFIRHMGAQHWPVYSHRDHHSYVRSPGDPLRADRGHWQSGSAVAIGRARIAGT
jgi:hypothetical protein